MIQFPTENYAPQDPTLQLISSPLNAFLGGQQTAKVQQLQEKALQDAQEVLRQRQLENVPKQYEATLATAKMQSPDYIPAQLAGQIGTMQTQEAAGKKAVAGLPIELEDLNLESKLSKAKAIAADMSLPIEQRTSAMQDVMMLTDLMSRTPKTVAAERQAEVKSQGQLSKLGNLAYREIAEARNSGRPAADWAIEIQNNPSLLYTQPTTSPQDKYKIPFFDRSQQQPTATQAVPQPQQPISEPNVQLGVTGLNEQEQMQIANRLAQNLKILKNPNLPAATLKAARKDISDLQSKYPSTVTPQTKAGAGAMEKGETYRTVTKDTPVPSGDTADQFTTASGEVIKPKTPEEREFISGMASGYRNPGQILMNRNLLTTTMANEVAVSLKNLGILTERGEKVPSTGAWSSLKNDTLFGAAASNILKPLTKQETLQVEALIKPLARMQAVLEYGPTGGSQQDRDRMEKAIIQEFGTADRVVALQKMGELRQAVVAALKGASTNQTMTRQQRESLFKNYQEIDKAFPFTATDVLEWQKSGMTKPFRDYITEKQSSGTSQEVKQITSDVDYANLPSGTIFVGPDGKRRRKP